MAGEVVGITTSHIKGGENLNFAVSVNEMKWLLSLGLSKAGPFPDEAEDDVSEQQDAPAKTFGNASCNGSFEEAAGCVAGAGTNCCLFG
jgi:hypothetical protein